MPPAFRAFFSAAEEQSGRGKTWPGRLKAGRGLGRAAARGVRIQVPMLGPVPIALDFGFPIVKGPGDKEQVFSFWLGFFR